MTGSGCLFFLFHRKTGELLSYSARWKLSGGYVRIREMIKQAEEQRIWTDSDIRDT
jgi:hypothetical protein